MADTDSSLQSASTSVRTPARWGALVAAAVFTGLALLATHWTLGASLTVDTTSDVSDGDTSSIANLIATPGADGVISLREAITAANNTAGGPHTINFNIGGCGGVCTISPTSALPTITRAVVLDGWSQPGWTNAPLIELDGTNAGATKDGLTLSASGSSTVRGFIINRFTRYGIYLTAGTSGNTLQGNYVGTDATGLLARANTSNGIYAYNSSSNQIGGTTTAQRNVVSGNGGAGIAVESSLSNSIQGNYVGLGSDGATALGNGGSGISIVSSSATVGGTAAGAGNVIGSNTNYGVFFWTGNSAGTVVLGNFVGLAVDGTTARGNQLAGIGIYNTPNVQVGDGTAVGRNIISGNVVSGIESNAANSPASSTIRGNYIGTNASGTSALPNGLGISIILGATAQIGGTAVGDGNVVSGNLGIGIQSGTTSSTLIQGNKVGTNAAGTAPITNGTYGIQILGISTVGGTATDSGNLISGNTSKGILVSGAAARATIQGNSIYSNGSLGIDLNNDGVTANNGTKNESLPNRDMDSPVFTSAQFGNGVLYVTGYVGSAANQSTFASSRVEVFLSDNDATGYGEGQTYLGYLTADASGNFSGSISTGSVAVGNKVTGTATDTTANNSTSEFGANFTVTQATFTISGTVFEDLNYGGGNGRNKATAIAGGGVVRASARVELYDNAGAFVTSTTTDASGNYSFTQQNAGNYTVRVVNSTVTSSRTGYTASHLAVQTFRTDASSGSATDVYDYVGGQTPNLVDAGSNTTNATLASLTTASATPQSITTVTGGNSTITGVNFGYSFNLVVNTNNSGQGSLRQFITNANALSNTGLAISGRTAGIDHAIFMISNGTAAAGLRAANNYFSSGVASIAPTSALPTITAAVVLDAQTQPGWTSAPIIELNGTNAGATKDGLTVSTNGNTVRGFIVNRFTRYGIYLTSGTSSNTVQGNYVGTDATGLLDRGNSSDGIYLPTATSNQIGGTTAAQRNVVSGNDGSGINLNGSSSNTVQGNYLGLGADGQTALGNSVYGLRMDNSGNNMIGGTTAGSGNIISSNLAGIFIRYAASTGNTLLGNWIGLAADGTTARGNSSFGLMIGDSTNNTQVGNGSASGRNVFSGSVTYDGINVQNGASNVTIIGNYIGTNAAGTAAVPNTSAGIGLQTGSTNTQIGGTTAGQGNLIAGNTGPGIYGVSDIVSATIQGNQFGLNATGNAVLTNGSAGIYLNGGVVTIGGTATGAGNLITGNTRGIYATGATTRASILGNSIYGNTSLGIDIGTVGVTANNGTKSESSPNRDMDFPVFTSAAFDGTTLFLSGYVGSAANQSTFAGARVEVFLSDNDATGYGEGQTYLGYLTADASGNFSGSFVPASAVAVGNAITGTATDTTTNNSTSEFSANVTVARVNVAGVVFEDLNYGGGNGRNRSTALAAGASVRSGARVELYNNVGAFVTSTTTGSDGSYRFSGQATGTYTVRVVGSTVTSSRTGYTASQLAVQTFRTDASGGTAADVYDHVGGETPNLADAASNTTNATLASLTAGSTTAQSITTVVDSGTSISGVDFGFSFNVIVNTNNSGQGSLRQFLTNANALSNTGLAISGRTAGIDHAIFMISNGTAASGLRAANNYFSSGVASIAPTSALPTITEALVIDAQTQPGWTSAPIVELNGTSVGATQNGLTLNVGGNTLRGLVINRFTNHGILANSGANSNVIQGNYIGTDITGLLAQGNYLSGIALVGSSNNQIGGVSATQHNVISSNGLSATPKYPGIGINSGLNNIIQGNYIGVGTDGSTALGNGAEGIAVSSGSATIGGTAAGAGNVVGSNGSHGISFYLGDVGGSQVLGNYIGVAANGSTARGNISNGIAISNTDNVQVGDGTASGRNVISGNSGAGVGTTSGTGARFNTILGNYIGTNAAGTAAVPNGSGIAIVSPTTAQIGGTAQGQGNLVSGNSTFGIQAQTTATIQGNKVGTNATGTAAIPNGTYGIYVASNATLGGTAAGAGNLVSGNTNAGIYVGGGTNNVIQGNTVGLAADGTSALPNLYGVQFNVATNPGGNTVGGTTTAARNVIGGNSNYNVYISTGYNVTVQGNYIGTNVLGSAAPTSAPSSTGIYIATGANNTIGGTNTGEGNRIAYNSARGIQVTGSSSTGNAIRGNAIYSNGALGIDLGSATGVTVNDGAKTANQPNLYMDYPVFTNASYDGTVLRVRGYVGSAPNQTTFGDASVDVFVSDEDATGYGEGRTYIGTLTADANGAWNGTFTTASVAVGNKLTATATDTSGNTSEFGANYDVRAYAPFRNGSFENGNLGATSNFGDGDYWALAVASTAVDYWVVENAAINVMPSTYWNASDGVRSVDLNADAGAGAISQTFDVEVGSTYSVFVDYSGSAACGPTRKGLRISAAGTTQDVADYLVGGGGVIPTASGSGRVYDLYYDTALFRFTATADLATLKFESLSTGLCGAVIDNVRVQLADPFTNGGFETGSDPGSVSTLASGSTAISSWLVGGNSINYVGSLWSATEGSRSVRLDGTGLGSVAQTFDALPESYYRARFALSADPNGVGARSANVSAGGTTQSFSSSNTNNPLTWADQAFVFRATDIATTLDFASLNATGAVIDNVRIEDALPFINGSFEDVRFPSRDSTDLTADNKLMRGWVTSGTALQHWGSATFAPSLGSYSLHLNGPSGPGTVSQTFDVTAGQAYDLLFDAAANPALAANQTLIATVVDSNVTIATRTITLNPSAVLAGQTRWRTQMISFTPTSSRVTLSFASQTAGASGLAIDNVRYGTVGTYNTAGQFNAFETNTAANAMTGVIKTKIVNQAFTLHIAALKFDRTGYSTYPMSGIKVELLDATDDSAGLDEITNCRSSWTSVATVTTSFALTAQDNGRKALGFTVNNAYRNLRVKISYPGTGTATVVGCSNDNFAVRPASFTGFTASDADDSTAGTARTLNNNGSGGVVHRAGRPFTVLAQAVDGSSNTVTNYTGTPTLSVVSCLVPTGCTAGTLSGSASTTAGVVAGNAFTYSEAGSISVMLEDATFADADSGDSTQDERAIRLGSAAVLGRFIPDRYQLTSAATPAMAHGVCGSGPGLQSFTFVGQNFGFATAPVVQATPLNAAGTALNNAQPGFDASHVSTSFVAVGAPVALGGSVSISSISATNTALIYYSTLGLSFTRDANTPVATFTPTFTLTVNLSDTSEPGATAPINAQAALTVSNIGFSGGTGNNLHYGRALLRPTYADLRSDLYLPLEVQRYTTLGWQTLTDAGACISAATTDFAYSDATGALNAGAGAPNCASRVTNSVTTASGRASILLPKPGGGATPSAMTVTLNVAGANGTSCAGAGVTTPATTATLSWLTGTSGAAPAARVSWGAPRSEYLLLRERYD